MKDYPEAMNNFVNEEFDCHFLDEGFTAKDILDQKINEVSSSVSGMSPRWRCSSERDELMGGKLQWGLKEM